MSFPFMHRISFFSKAKMFSAAIFLLATLGVAHSYFPPLNSTHGKQGYTFPNCLHHENPGGCNTRWNQRWWMNTDNWSDQTGPIFIWLAGEWTADSDINNQQLAIYAEEYGAMILVLEHRYYGESRPTAEETPTPETRMYGTSKQALADAAYFIDDFKRHYDLLNNKWSVFGCSYSANLAAWFKSKYPTYASASVSSSGPVEAVYDFPGYARVVSEVIRAVDEDCFDIIHEAFTCMETVADGGSCGTFTDSDGLRQALNYCPEVDFDDQNSKESFFMRTGFNIWAANWPSNNARNACSILKSKLAPTAVERYGHFLLDTGNNAGCISHQAELEEIVRLKYKLQLLGRGKIRDEYDAYNSNSWDWQTCNEFGYYMSSDPELGLFGRNTWTGAYYGQSCEKYGWSRDDVEAKIRDINTYYGGNSNFGGKCTIFVNGAWDPWHSQSIYDSQNAGPDNTVVFISNGEHCDDTNPSNNPEVGTAQERIKAQIGTNMNNPSCAM